MGLWLPRCAAALCVCLAGGYGGGYGGGELAHKHAHTHAHAATPLFAAGAVLRPADCILFVFCSLSTVLCWHKHAPRCNTPDAPLNRTLSPADMGGGGYGGGGYGGGGYGGGGY